MIKRVFLQLFAFTLLYCSPSKENIKTTGYVFGTTYSIQYYSTTGEDYQQQFDSIFNVINQSMSTYIDSSIISKVNRNETQEIDFHFKRVLEKSFEIYNETNGLFDPTIGVVVNAWDFVPQGRIQNLDRLKIDSLMAYVGLNKITLKDQKLTKPYGAYIDFNAIAKGYALDVTGEFLESKEVQDYLIEIGGEIRTKGINKEKNTLWKVGIEMPHFDGSQSIMKAVALTDVSMATSGTYRKFKVDEQGNRYSHIIDTKTSYPSKTNLLSISVIAEDCMTADAYATAFKAMGIDKIKHFLNTHPEFKVFLIFENEKKELETMALNHFPEH